VPALLHLSGRSSWWLPAWLDRILPAFGVERPAPAGGSGPPGADAPVGNPGRLVPTTPAPPPPEQA